MAEKFEYTEDDRMGFSVQDEDNETLAQITGFDMKIYLATDKIKDIHHLKEVCGGLAGAFESELIKIMIEAQK